VKAATIGLVVGVSGRGSLDWSLRLVNVDGRVWRQGTRQEQVRQIAPKKYANSVSLVAVRDDYVL
jgi:hypothetical protein